MPNYSGIQKEEILKGLVHDDYFSNFGYEPNIDNIDFVITDKKARGDLFSDGAGSSRHYLWAETKKGTHDVFNMFTQLLLACKKTYEKGDHLAPPWLGVFDEARISFVAFHDILPIFNEIDFNWNQTPSNHDTTDFQKARRAVEKLIGAKIIVYNFGAGDDDIKEFIKTHFVMGASASIKSPITKDNFAQIFIKWIKEVKPFINISKDDWSEFRRLGIHDGDFFRADVMSEGGNTITERIKIVLKSDNYRFNEKIHGRLFTSDIDFTDKGAAYNRFWNKYERPPAEVYQKFIVERRDLLSSRNIRETKGTFFTPKIWSDKSKEYLAEVFGDDWQEKYYIWDCAAGTGNLLAGLTNPYNVWASDIEAGNVETMRSLVDIDENLNLLDAHIFQFDFLNDILTEEEYERQKGICAKAGLPPPERKLPPLLCEIIDNPEKRKKLIVYVNPPYAEASSAVNITRTGENKRGVTITHNAHNEYKNALGKAANELFSLFMMRIANKLSGAYLAVFSKLKYVNSANFVQFRANFSAQFQKGFICRSDTFDNVRGKFPIGFLIWRLSYNGYDFKFPKSVRLDVINEDGKRAAKKKGFYNSGKYINKWIKELDMNKNGAIGFMVNSGADFLKTNQTYLTVIEGTRHFNYFAFHENNIIGGCIYFAVRLCITPTWLNDRDQFLYPNNKYKIDIEFQNDCLIFTLFHGQNRISRNDGVNHWIPFTEKEVDAKEKFESNFMSNYLKGKTFSIEARSVLTAGLELWKYYHQKIKNNRTASANASFYDIREFFQGRKESGNMNAKSNDETYNALIANVRDAQKVLAKKIEPKVYEYGFLKE
jgi:hypothetical protein